MDDPKRPFDKESWIDYIAMLGGKQEYNAEKAELVDRLVWPYVLQLHAERAEPRE